MEQRKSLRRKVSNFFAPPKPEPLAPASEVEFEEGTQREEHNEAVPQQDNMLPAPIPQKQTRLQRFSSFLPSLSTPSKLYQDVLRKPVPARKQPPSQYDAPDPNAPSRSSPAAPTSNFDPARATNAPASELANSPVAPSPNRLKKSNGFPPLESEAWEKSSFVGDRRVTSNPSSTQSTTYQSEGEGGGNTVKKLRRKSWLPGGKTRSTYQPEERIFEAWVNAGKHKIQYDFHPLLNGTQVILSG